MSDFALHPDTHDLYFKDGRLALVSGVELFAQQLRIRLNRQLGEWMWDITRGIPYREEIFVRQPSLGSIAAHFKHEILGTPHALRLESFDIGITNQTLHVNFIVVTDFGRVSASGGVTPGRAQDETSVGALTLLLLVKPLGAIL